MTAKNRIGLAREGKAYEGAHSGAEA